MHRRDIRLGVTWGSEECRNGKMFPFQKEGMRMTEDRMVRTTTEVLAYPVLWRCYCDAPPFGTYNIAGPQAEYERVMALAMEHRANHKRVKS